jgi:serine/threonine protein kinase
VLNDISFQKGRLLGAGTFGRVYEAINLVNGEIIAVKQIELKSKRAEETVQQPQPPLATPPPFHPRRLH